MEAEEQRIVEKMMRKGCVKGGELCASVTGGECAGDECIYSHGEELCDGGKGELSEFYKRMCKKYGSRDALIRENQWKTYDRDYQSDFDDLYYQVPEDLFASDSWRQFWSTFLSTMDTNKYSVQDFLDRDPSLLHRRTPPDGHRCILSPLYKASNHSSSAEERMKALLENGADIRRVYCDEFRENEEITDKPSILGKIFDDDRLLFIFNELAKKEAADVPIMTQATDLITLLQKHTNEDLFHLIWNQAQRYHAKESLCHAVSLGFPEALSQCFEKPLIGDKEWLDTPIPEHIESQMFDEKALSHSEVCRKFLEHPETLQYVNKRKVFSCQTDTYMIEHGCEVLVLPEAMDWYKKHEHHMNDDIGGVRLLAMCSAFPDRNPLCPFSLLPWEITVLIIGSEILRDAFSAPAQVIEPGAITVEAIRDGKVTIRTQMRVPFGGICERHLIQKAVEIILLWYQTEDYVLYERESDPSRASHPKEVMFDNRNTFSLATMIEDPEFGTMFHSEQFAYCGPGLECIAHYDQDTRAVQLVWYSFAK